MAVTIETACSYWVAPPPVGDDNNSGTIDHPWATLQHANRNVSDDQCTVWFQPGEYVGGNRLNRRFDTQTVFKSIEPYRAVLLNNGPVVIISGATNITLEGFDIQHSGSDASPLLIFIDGSDEGWSEHIVLRNNIIHDSYNNDLLKIFDRVRFTTIENNIFYNQGPTEEHMDVNSVTDVVIQDNIFFNDYEASGRLNQNNSKQFIVIKDSNGAEDGLIGSQRVTVRRNIFLNWEGQDDETFIQVGLDGKPYYEAIDTRIENNLLIGNSANPVGAAFGVRGAKDVYFINNTIVGDLPANAYATRVAITQENPPNQNIFFHNNIWSDPTGTMGDEFSDGDPADTENLVLNNNLYWNRGVAIPDGDLFSPLQDDPRRIVSDPWLAKNQSNIVLPYWNGSSFLSGKESIRDEFIRLARKYAMIFFFSPAKNEADPAFAPIDDILGQPRTGLPDLGAYEDSFTTFLFSPFISR
jgi:hypothetical protein